MKDLSDILFRFPDKPEAGSPFVTSVLGLFATPAMVVDRRMRVHLVNLQGQDMLFRFAAETKKEPASGHRGRGRQGSSVLPRTLRDPVRSCLKEGRAVSLKDFAAPGVRSDRYDLVLCPGEIKGADFCFILMLRPYIGSTCIGDPVLNGVLESINGCAVALDREARFQVFNKRYLEVFDLRPEEVVGVGVSELNPSKQGRILESQVKHLMRAGQIRNSSADTLTTSRRGVLVTSITAWPLKGSGDHCEGMFVLLQPAPRTAPLSFVDEKTRELFGQTAIEQGPPMFFTQMDGKIITMNVGARGLLQKGAADHPDDIRSALEWVHPELIDQLYADLLGGLNTSMLHTDIETRAGRRIFMVQAIGLKEVGDITSTVLIHLQDMTEVERSRNLLARTARRLATEKEILDTLVTELQNIRVAYAVVDRDLRVIRVSDSVLNAFNKGADYFIGKKVYEVDPSTRESGIIAFVKTAMERGQRIQLERFGYKLPGDEEVVISLAFHPMTVDGQQACLVTAENLTEREAGTSKLVESSRRLQALMETMEEGVAVLDRNGKILDVNHVIYGAAGMSREEMIGKNEREVMLVEEGDLLVDFRRRAMLTHQPVSTGCIKLTSKVREGAVFADISYIPLLDSEGAVREILAIVRYLTDVVNLEKKIEEYTANLERLVRERTSELTSANEELESTVGKLASMARSGLVLSSLKDMESVMHAFLEEAREVMAADFVSVALITGAGGSSRTTYYSSGAKPPSGAMPSEIIEKRLTGLALGDESRPADVSVGKDLLIKDFSLADMRGLLLVWKEKGEFSAIDGNLSKLLCTQLGFAMPVTQYVGELRTERDRSRCLRMIAYRTAGSPSVSSAIGIVAEELSKVMAADRFYWLVSKDGGNIWMSEVRLSPRAGLNGRRQVGGEDAACFAPVLEACRNSHRIFCDRFPTFGAEGFAPDGHMRPAESCSFADPCARSELVKCLKGLLRDRDMIRRDGGALAIAPVMLSDKSYGLICAFNEMGVPFTLEESCFMCLAASTVGHMWQAADASRSIRRLEAEGETLSELAHDLKYPLMRVREMLDKVSTGAREHRKDLEGVAEINDEISTLNTLAEELIDISNRKERQPEILDVCEVIDRCISLMERDAASRSVAVRRLADSPPPAFANKKDVKNILINVLANSVEAAGENGWVNIKVGHSDSGPDGGSIRVVITDSGPGVPEELLERVFDPFYTTKGQGGGIGLFSAKKRANANGGDVCCEIGEDGKSRFVIRLPLGT